MAYTQGVFTEVYWLLEFCDQLNFYCTLCFTRVVEVFFFNFGVMWGNLED